MSKRVLVTGGAGFIGHHVIDVLLMETDWEIVSLDRLDYSGNLNRLDEVVNTYVVKDRQRVKIVFHDLKADLNPQIRSRIGPIDIIIHLAAASHVDRSIDFPLEFLNDNTLGTVNLLEYAKSLPNLERFVYFSTDEVFGPAPNGTQYKEYDRYNSSNPYSASKAAAEEFCVAYENTYKLPIIITHTMNVFGERQLPEKFIPLCIRSVRDNMSVTIHSDATRTVAGSRFYIHALDVASALLFLLNAPFVMQKNIVFNAAGYDPAIKIPKFNIVGKEEIDNLSLAKIIANAQLKELRYEMVDFHSSRPGHDLRYALDGSLMKSLGWEPEISLTERINDMVLWSLNNRRWLDL
jgi:dTDP-glucose 4,6-dehydratase